MEAFGFWILGLPEPWFWGVIMGILSLLPAVCASFVWGPAAVFLMLDGPFGQAVILVLCGLLLIAPIQHFLYPMILGHQLKLHNALVVIAVLGGCWWRLARWDWSSGRRSWP